MGEEGGRSTEHPAHGGNDQLQNRSRVFAFNLPSELTRYLRRANATASLTFDENESAVSEI